MKCPELELPWHNVPLGNSKVFETGRYWCPCTFPHHGSEKCFCPPSFYRRHGRSITGTFWPILGKKMFSLEGEMLQGKVRLTKTKQDVDGSPAGDMDLGANHFPFSIGAVLDRPTQSSSSLSWYQDEKQIRLQGERSRDFYQCFQAPLHSESSPTPTTWSCIDHFPLSKI